ncbi:hypothetical protein PR002_g20703 [Phytophthora rubi]|uniref:Transposon Tf2-6 polyprotein n=1 Tax=Phytophthora rubi TaxID=129364 RepID=A0A6A3JCK1_9STRA|nr:hypothetical protein PR002_g20703 [Phytophthora rubi]
MDPEVLEDERTSKRQTRYGAAILKGPSDPYYALLKEFSDVVSDDPRSVLPPDMGVRNEIDLVPGTKYCTTRQWPLPKEQVDVIDAFFAAKHAAGMVRESKSPHSSPTFCVRKPNGKWRMVHAFNKLNAATILASTPIPRKDVLQSNMAGCTIFSALDMVDGYYQLLMRESDIPLTAVSTPSGMLWEWLVMPQGLSNVPATFNRLVTQLFRPMRQFVQTYFDDIFVHSRASEGKTAVEAHLGHLREVLLCMRENRLYANINKYIFGAEEIPFLGCFLGKDGVRADPEKVCASAQWPVPVSQKDLRKWLGLANYLHKYSANYAEMARPLTNLLKKDAVWPWTSEAQQAFEATKNSLQSTAILALPDEDRPFSVAAEKNYPVHDKELLAMKYALVKFRVHLLGQKPFVIYTDHASLRTATSSPHLSQRMAQWLSFFAEYNFTVEYKAGKQNVLADALSRRPDYELAHLAYLESPLYELIREAYAADDDLAGLVEALSAPDKAVELTARQRSRLHRYSVVEGLLYYQVDGGDEPRIVVPNDEDLRHRVLYEAHDTPLSGHLGREKTSTSVTRNFWWPHMYKWVRKYVQTCETCQRVKPAPSASAPLMSLPVPADCWRSVSMDFIFELQADARGHTERDCTKAAQLFVDNVFRNHGLPEAFVSDRDPRFVSHFWQHPFRLLGTRLDMSTADHPQTDGQTERVNRVLEDILRSVCAAKPTQWSTLLPQVEFALNNAVHSSTGFTPFYVNRLRHPRTPLTLPPASSLVGGEANADDPRGLKGLRTSVKRNLLSFIETGAAARQRVRDAMTVAQDIQKEQSDRQGRKNTQVFKLGDQVLLNANNLPTQAVSAVGSTKLRPRFVGPFTVIGVHGHAYTLDLPSSMATHPTFYIGLLKPYHPAGAVDPEEPTVSQSTDGRRSPSSEQPLPREAGQGRELEPDQEHEPLRGVPPVPPSGPHGRTERGSSRGASPDPDVPARRSPRLANIGSTGGQRRHQAAEADPRRGLAGSLSPVGRLGASPGGPPHLGREREAPPCQIADHPAVADKIPHQREDSPGQDGNQSGDAERSGRTPLPLRAPPPLIGNEGVLYYHVEKLLKRRGRSGQYQYLVKWRGYPSSRNSWESEARLEEDCTDLVASFESAHGPGRR